MATWEDGPEYAPLERPSGFGVPDIAPLESAEPYVQVAADAPKDRPQFADPQDPVQPLQALVPTVGEHRDPHTPFQTIESTMTAQPPATSPTEPLGSGAPFGQQAAADYAQVVVIDGAGTPGQQQISGGSGQSAWGAAHWSPPAGPPAGGGQWGPPQQAPPPGGFPHPGTPQWFGPGSQPGQPQARPGGPVEAKTVVDAITPGVAITLVVGGLVYFLAPILITVAFFLTSRITVAQKEVRRAFSAAFGVVGLVALVGLFTHNLSFGDWWGFIGAWALVLSWALLIATATLIYRALKNGARPQQPRPPHQQNWG